MGEDTGCSRMKRVAEGDAGGEARDGRNRDSAACDKRSYFMEMEEEGWLLLFAGDRSIVDWT